MTLYDNPHDTLFKQTFSQPPQAVPLLRHALPHALAQHVGWNGLELQDSSVRSQHGELHADLMYRAPAPPGRSPFFLLEHKSGPDAATCYQLFQYLGAIWHRHQVRRSKRVVVLPPVFAVVVAHGRHRWRGQTLADVIGWPWPQPEYMPNLPIFVLDLTRMTSDEIRSLPMPALSRVTLFCLSIARDRRDVLAELAPWIPELRALQADDDGVRGLESVLWYLVQVANVPHADLAKFLGLEVGPIAKEVLMTTLSQVTKEVRKLARARALAEGRAEGLAKGHAEGLAEGHAEGHAEGVAEGQAVTLLKLLTVRFGPLSASVEQRIRRAKVAERDRWIGRLLGARTLADVLRRD